MTDNLPQDYTVERARVVYSRSEFTRWAIQKQERDISHLPPFHIDLIALRGSYVIFHFGYEDEKSWPLAYAAIPTDPNKSWWKPMLWTVKDYYLRSRFYVG